MSNYFSDRENAPVPRNHEVIDSESWRGIFAIIDSMIQKNSFGWKYPKQCDDGSVACGVDIWNFWNQAKAEIPLLAVCSEDGQSDDVWPPNESCVPQINAILDFIEFSARSVGRPIIVGNYHVFLHHHHYTFDRDTGLAEFVKEINRLLSRRGIAFEINSEGIVHRLLSEAASQILENCQFQTGERETDELFEKSISLIKSPRMEDRRDALEKIWDAFERLKTLYPGRDKRTQADSMIEQVTDGCGEKFRIMIEDEAKALTGFGNEFRIRHSEVTQEKLADPKQIDYLFFRMITFLGLIRFSPSQSI